MDSIEIRSNVQRCTNGTSGVATDRELPGFKSVLIQNNYFELKLLSRVCVIGPPSQRSEPVAMAGQGRKKGGAADDGNNDRANVYVR